MDNSVLQQIFIAVVSGLLVVLFTAVFKAPARWRTAKRERATRHEEHVWGRREAFESLLADFGPVYQKWSRLQGAMLRMQFRRMSDMDPEPEPDEVDVLASEVKKYISKLRDRSPSGVLRSAVAKVAEKHEAIEHALIFNNHVLISGNDENKDEAYYEFYDKMDDFDEAVRDLSEATYKDGQPDAPRKADPVSVIGIVVFAGMAIGLGVLALSVNAVWLQVILWVLVVASVLMLAGPISTFWTSSDQD